MGEHREGREPPRGLAHEKRGRDEHAVDEVVKRRRAEKGRKPPRGPAVPSRADALLVDVPRADEPPGDDENDDRHEHHHAELVGIRPRLHRLGKEMREGHREKEPASGRQGRVARAGERARHEPGGRGDRRGARGRIGEQYL